MDAIRITELPSKTYVDQGDYMAIDNQNNGTKKVQFTNLLDDTLSQENRIAPANVVGDEIATIRAAVGSPLKASTVAQMTDENKIYVYVGSESGYTNGDWYYWDGSAWISGGVYNSVAVVTDPTLTLSGVPADAKATGDEITNLKHSLRIMCCSNQSYVYDQENKTLTIPQGFIIYNNTPYILNSQVIDLSAVETTQDAWVLKYHRGTNNDDSYIYALRWYATVVGIDDNTVGYVYQSISFINGLKNAYGNPFAYMVNTYGNSKGFVAWDFNTKTLTVSKGGFVITDRGKFNVLAGVYDFSDIVTTYNAYQVVFLTDGTITARPWTAQDALVGYYIGSIYGNALSILGDVKILESKKVVHVFGDSITAGVGCDRPYHLLLAMADEVICYNWGVGSTGYVAEASGSVVVGNGIIGDGSNQTESGNNTVLDIMTGKTFSSCIIFAGTNDYGGNIPLTTFRTAVQNTLNYALAQTNDILVITPLKRNYNNVPYTQANSAGYTLADYSAVIKEECESRLIGYVDGFDINIDPTNANMKSRLTTDGLHPNDDGQRRIAGAIRQAFEENCGIL